MAKRREKGEIGIISFCLPVSLTPAVVFRTVPYVTGRAVDVNPR